MWYHDPLITDKNGNTVAMILASKRIIPPPEWLYKENYNYPISDYNGKTAAMILAEHGIIPPIKWCRDPKSRNTNNETIAALST